MKTVDLTQYDKIELFSVDFTHYRLEDLISLANQAKPFYEWIEKQFQLVMHVADPFEEIVKKATLEEIKKGISACMNSEDISKLPKLYDGGGIPYKHKRACYFMFSWMVRDAATQRLKPLITRAKDLSGLSTTELEIEVLATLIYHYRDKLNYFDWPVIREVTIQRLEGSRRAKKGSAYETHLRTSLAQAFSYYYQTHGNYGKYADFKIYAKPLKVKNRTYDAAVELIKPNKDKQMIVVSAKTRETEGGGHAHLFTRDIEQANEDILEEYSDAIIAFMIVAQNWSADEISMLQDKYADVFYFNINPNEFTGFNDQQIKMNIFIERVLNGYYL